MKIKLISLLMALALCLNGCAFAGLIGGDQPDESKDQAEPKTKKTTSSSQSSQPTTSPSTESQYEDPYSELVRDILAYAQQDKLFAVVYDRESPYYKELAQEADLKKITVANEALGASKEKIFLVALADQLTICLEQVDYSARYNYFQPVSSLAQVQAQTGDVFVLEVFLAETIPQQRISALTQGGDQLAYWYCAQDGYQAEDISYIDKYSSRAPLDYNSNICALSIAACLTALMEGRGPQPPAELTPQELMSSDMLYWYTVASALTILEDQVHGSYSWASTQIPCQTIHACGAALFPGLYPDQLNDSHFSWPDPDPGSGRNYGGEECAMQPFEYGDLIEYSIIGIDYDYQTGQGSIQVNLLSDHLSEYSISYQVDWQPEAFADPANPFPYQMTAMTRIG